MKRRTDQRSGVVVQERAPAHVWHASLSLAAHEGQLTDEQWNAIASDFVDEMGFSSAGGKAECRWVAIRHGLSKNGNDHIHLAVSMVRTDGTKASTHNDFRRAQNACRDLEAKYGLAITGDRSQGLGTRGIAPGAKGASETRGATEADAVRLARTVRAASAASADEGEFVRRCRRAGLLIRPRFAQGRTDVVEGYSAALRPPAGLPVIWHGGGKLARDLTLPRLRADWDDSVESANAAAAEWQAAYRNERPFAPGREVAEPDPILWGRYTEEVKGVREQLAGIALDDRAGWARVAREASGVLAAWSVRVEPEPGPLAQASAELARTAQLQAHAVQPRPARASSMSGAAMMLAAASMKGNSPMAQAILLRELARCAQAIASMMEARGDAIRAQQMAERVREQLREVAAKLPAPAGTVTPIDPALTELHRFDRPGQRGGVGGSNHDSPRPAPEQQAEQADDLDR